MTTASVDELRRQLEAIESIMGVRKVVTIRKVRPPKPKLGDCIDSFLQVETAVTE